MADNLLSSFPITDLLSALGARPGRSRNTYHSPFREDCNASLHIDLDRNIWYDHGMGVGGGNVDLVMRCHGCTAREAAEYILALAAAGPMAGSCSPSGDNSGTASVDDSVETPGNKSKKQLESRILMVRELRSLYLLDYVASRGIPPSIASHYCKEVILRGKTNGHTYEHIGFPNNSGGYALKSPSGFKSTTKAGVSTIDTSGEFSERATSNTVSVFEGFFDFLSWLASRNQIAPTTDVLVLNSVTNLRRALPYLRSHVSIFCCLDNDDSGRTALDTLRSLRLELGDPTITDGSFFYQRYKDVNEWWVAMKNLK